MRISNMTRIPGRAEEHAFRHMIFPKLHRLTENAGLDLYCAQMCCCRQTIRPRADDCHLMGKSSLSLHVHAFRNSLWGKPFLMICDFEPELSRNWRLKVLNRNE